MVKCGNPACPIKFEPTARQKGAIKKGQRIFCGAECRLLVNNERSRLNYKKRTPKPKECRFCGKMFIPKKTNQQYCPPSPGVNGCQYEAMRIRNRDQYKSIRNRVEPSTAGRSCNKCGRDPAPNYFFCRNCHSMVGCNDVDSWHSIGLWG